MFKRTITGAAAALALAISMAAPAAAAAPQVYTRTAEVTFPYFDCGTFEAHAVWTINSRLTVFVDPAGTPISDHEVVDFSGAFVNPDTGASIADSGRIVYRDTLDANGDILTTTQMFVRRSAYLHEAGRYDFQTDMFSGMSNFDAGLAAACAALGA